jgi:hypothetical protein
MHLKLLREWLRSAQAVQNEFNSSAAVSHLYCAAVLSAQVILSLLYKLQQDTSNDAYLYVAVVFPA